MRFMGCFLLAIACAGAPALGQVVSIKKEAPVTSIEGQDLFVARNVLMKFFRSEKHPECYRVLFSEYEGNLRVDFDTKDEPVILPVGEVDTSEPPCGRDVGYLVNKKGTVLRRIYSR